MTTELADLFELWTPSAIQSYVANVAAGYQALAADIAAKPALSASQLKAWQLLLANFQEFRSGVGFFSSLTMAPLRTAEAYAKQLGYWRDMYQRASGQPATGAMVEIPSETQSTPFKAASMLIGGGLAAYLFVAILQRLPRR